MDVSVIIINYNTFELTSACIKSVQKYTHGITYEIILVDNGSTDFLFEDFQRLFPNVNLIVSPVNLGFARGNNLGILRAKGRHILLLNSDTLLKDNAIKTTFDYLKTHPKAGAVSTRLVFPNGKHQSVCQRFPSIRYHLFELFRLQKLFPKKISGNILLGAFFDHKENAVADWVWGAFFMFRSEILAKLTNQKLDETFFMYCEDMQWCWDIRKLGYEVHYCAGSEIIHYMGKSSENKKQFMSNNYKLFMKNNYNLLHRKCIETLTFLGG